MVFWRKMVRSFYRSHGLMAVNSLSFSVLLYFIPFALAIASLSYLSPISNQIINKSLKYLFMHFLPQTGDILYNQFRVFLHRSFHLPWFGIVFLIVTAFNMMLTVENHINQIWHVRQSRKIYQALPIHAGFIVCSALLIYAEVYLRLVLLELNYFPLLMHYLIDGLNFLLTWIVFSCIYKFIPSVKISLSSAGLAGVVATIILSLSKMGFVYYATHFFRNNDLIYGSLVIIPLFMLWVYIGMFNLLFWAQIVYVRELAGKFPQQCT